MALCPGLPGWASTRKVKPMWIILKQETASVSDINWAVCKAAPRSREITMPTPHHSVFYRLDALPAAQPTASMHWRHKTVIVTHTHIHTHLMALCPGPPGWAGTRKVKPIWILLKQKTVMGHMQVCTSLQSDNHTPPLSFFTGRMPFLPPNQQRQSTEG